MAAETGVGFAGMRERMHELNGTLEIESDGCGTNLRATVPLFAMPHPVPVGTLGEVCASACA